MYTIELIFWVIFALSLLFSLGGIILLYWLKGGKVVGRIWGTLCWSVYGSIVDGNVYTSIGEIRYLEKFALEKIFLKSSYVGSIESTLSRLLSDYEGYDFVFIKVNKGYLDIVAGSFLSVLDPVKEKGYEECYLCSKNYSFKLEGTATSTCSKKEWGVSEVLLCENCWGEMVEGIDEEEAQTEVMARKM